MGSVAVVAAALSGVLCSGATAAVMRATEPDVVAIDGPRQVAAEQRHLVELLAEPGAPYVASSPGAELPPTDALRALGYERGWTRTFTATGRSVESFVLQFARDEGATGYAHGIGGAARLLAKPVPFDVAGVPGATGLADTVKDASGRYLRLVALSRGRFAALLVVRTAANGADVTALARRQYDALGA